MIQEKNIEVIMEPEIEKIIKKAEEPKKNADLMSKVAKWCDDNGWFLGPLTMRYGSINGVRVRLKLTWTGIEWQERCKGSKSELLADPSKPFSWRDKPFVPAGKIKLTGKFLKLGSRTLLPQNR